MAYATIQDLVDAFGEAELVRATTPDGADMAGVVPGRAQPKLDEASGLMDSYLRRRYVVPVPHSPELRACCCALARHSLGFTGSTLPTEQARLARKEAIEWLDGIAAGRVTLDGAVPAGPLSGARVQDRPPMVRAGGPI